MNAASVQGAVLAKARVETDAALVVAQAAEVATNPAPALAATVSAHSAAKKFLTKQANAVLTKSAPIVGQK
jgi:hypothetical protein